MNSPTKDTGCSLRLTVTAGPHVGRVFQFEGHDTFIVGRSKQAHFRLPNNDEYFSRVHFMVEVNAPHCRLMDMGSTNGTYVNGARAAVIDLHDGDLIQGGQTVLRVSIVDDEEIPSTLGPGVPAEEPAPPLPPASYPMPAAVTEPGPGVCVLCTAPTKAATGPDWSAFVCDSCREQAVGQVQPIPGYTLGRQLGRGAMGVVHAAVRCADGAAVALKTILPKGDVSPLTVRRFLREVDILRQLRHPHIISLLDAGEADGQVYFAMDLVRGTDAGKVLKAEGPLPIARAVRLVCQLLEALQYAHKKGFVHRDVKPGNILVRQEGDREVALLADFGLARVYQASRLSGLTLTGQMGGTLAFMPPEQITDFRDARPAADQYSAAATLYNLLTGQILFDFPLEVPRRMLMILHDQPVPLRTRRPDVPEALAAAVHRGLGKEPEGRFADVAEMRWALVAATPGEPGA